MATKCRHCGSTSYGHGCAYGPNRLHEHRDDEKHCEWCGSSSYGHGCAYGPDRLHRHGPGGNKCIWLRLDVQWLGLSVLPDAPP